MSDIATVAQDILNNATVVPSTAKCPICGGIGDVMEIDAEGVERWKSCECTLRQHAIRRLKSSGLVKLAERCTFENFIVSEPWQQKAKTTAQAYVDDDSDKWLFIGGQVGCGKTHICTAVSVGLINKGRAVRYLLWREYVGRMKSLHYRPEQRDKYVAQFQNTKVLYIDDFLKGNAEQWDIEIAFELINYRYNNNLKTIISSEYFAKEITQLDEGLGSRIAEMSGGYRMDIMRDANRNQRIKHGANHPNQQ